MEGVGDDVLVQVVAQVAVEAGADVLVDRLQLDEDQRQAVDEADEIGAAVVVRRAQAGDFSSRTARKRLFGCRRAVAVRKSITRARRIAELAAGVAVAHRHAVADAAVELLIVLDQRAAKSCRVSLLAPPPRWPPPAGRDSGAPAPRAGRASAPPRACRPAQRAARPEGLVVPGVDALPAEHLLQVSAKVCLHQPVFAVDVGVRHVVSSIRLSRRDLPAHQARQQQVAGGLEVQVLETEVAELVGDGGCRCRETLQ